MNADTRRQLRDVKAKIQQLRADLESLRDDEGDEEVDFDPVLTALESAEDEIDTLGGF